MIKLRKILLYDFIYVAFIIFSFFIAFINADYKEESIYKGNETTVEGIVLNIKEDGDKLTLEIKDKEKIIVNYYFKTKKEKDDTLKRLKLGDRLKFSGEIKKVNNNTIFNGFNYKKYLISEGIYYTFSAKNIEKIKDNTKLKYKIKQSIINLIEKREESRSYLKALILGNTYEFDANISRSYQIIGVSHLFAISGSHITFLSVVLLFIFKKLKITELKRYLLVILILISYMFLTDYPASIMRAGVFFILLSINMIWYFNIKIINILLLAGSLLMLYNPYYIYDIGFQFSFIISMYLIWMSDTINECKSSIGKVFLVSFISFFASLPVIMMSFYQFNILSSIINLLYVPFVTFIVFPLSLVTLLIPPLDYFLDFLIFIMEKLSLFLSKLDIFNIIICKINIWIFIFYYLVITLVFYMYKKGKEIYFIILFLILLIHYLMPYFNKITSITMIDVGQGDSYLIRLPKNKNILIDTGGKLVFDKEKWQQRKKETSLVINSTIPMLKSLGIKGLDYLILTHGDVDHMGEALNLVDNFKIKKVIMNNNETNELEKTLIKNLNKKKIPYYFYKNKDILKINETRFDFINLENEEDENESSLVFYLTINNIKMLFTGDMGIKTEEKLMNMNLLQEVDILKIGHHGSKHSTSPTFLDIVKPKHALISVGLNNLFGHPTKEVMKNLEIRRIKTYLTSIDGSVKITLKKGTVTFSTSPP